MAERFARWVSTHEGFYEGYWFWVGLIGLICCVAFTVDAWQGTRDRDPHNYPHVIQSRGQFIAGILSIIGVGISTLLGWWAIINDTLHLRMFVLIGLLTMQTGWVALVAGVWIARRLALRNIKLSNNNGN